MLSAPVSAVQLHEHGAIPRSDNSGQPCAGAGVTWKLGKSVDSIDEDDGDEVNTKLIENNNNDDNKQDRVPLARAGTSCVR